MKEACAVILVDENRSDNRSKYPIAVGEVLFKPLICWGADNCRGAGIENIAVRALTGQEQIGKLLPQQCVVTENIKEYINKTDCKEIVFLPANLPFMGKEVIASSLNFHHSGGCDVTVIKSASEETIACWVKAQAFAEVFEDKEFCLPEQIAEKMLTKGKKTDYYCCKDEIASLKANNMSDLLKLNEIANKIEVDRLLEDGVNFYCMDGVVISPDAVVGRDTTIAPGTQLKGKVTIGEDCVIGPSTIIENSSLGDGCCIHSSFIESSEIGNRVKIGPNSHLRPNSRLADGVKIGNFVEVKNSTLGEKTSVAHLTYIGDSDFGSRINVGCGVVTVNYNGYQKFRSVVEDDAFIGCNTNLVSPVRVGQGAYIAAGSTITSDVESDSLAIARARQQDKKGWAASYRQSELLKKEAAKK